MNHECPYCGAFDCDGDCEHPWTADGVEDDYGEESAP